MHADRKVKTVKKRERKIFRRSEKLCTGIGRTMKRMWNGEH